LAESDVLAYISLLFIYVDGTLNFFLVFHLDGTVASSGALISQKLAVMMYIINY